MHFLQGPHRVCTLLLCLALGFTRGLTQRVDHDVSRCCGLHFGFLPRWLHALRSNVWVSLLVDLLLRQGATHKVLYWWKSQVSVRIHESPLVTSSHGVIVKYMQLEIQTSVAIVLSDQLPTVVWFFSPAGLLRILWNCWRNRSSVPSVWRPTVTLRPWPVSTLTAENAFSSYFYNSRRTRRWSVPSVAVPLT